MPGGHLGRDHQRWHVLVINLLVHLSLPSSRALAFFFPHPFTLSLPRCGSMRNDAKPREAEALRPKASQGLPAELPLQRSCVELREGGWAAPGRRSAPGSPM